MDIIAANINQSTKETPFQLLYGRRARLPNDVTNWPPPNLNPTASEYTQNILKNIQLSQDIAQQHNEDAQTKMKERYDQNSTPVKFKVGGLVLLRDSMKQKGKNPTFLPNYRGPYELVDQLSPITFKLGNTHSKMISKAHVNRLKPFVGLDKRIIQSPRPPLLPDNLVPNDNTQITSSGNDDITDVENITIINPDTTTYKLRFP